MRHAFAFISTTVDGYVEGPNREFDFWTVDDEFNAFSARQLDTVDTLVFGRVTYEGMAAYWPTPEAEADDASLASRINSVPKVVVSRTLGRADWANTSVVREVAELEPLKRARGRDIAVFGSSRLVVSMLRAGLLDEVRIMVNPIAIGAGRSVFETADGHVGLRLLGTEEFKSGNVLLRYAPAGV